MTRVPPPAPQFLPRDYVTVTLLGLGYPGRVDRVTWDGHEWGYTVEYADDKGDLQRRDFYGDEIASRPAEGPTGRAFIDDPRSP